jgi:hypothetical protein
MIVIFMGVFPFLVGEKKVRSTFFSPTRNGNTPYLFNKL